MPPEVRFRKGSLSRAQIVEAALRLAEHEPIEALTVRSIASELGASAMALYTHFANKDELLDGMRAAITDHAFRFTRKHTWSDLLEAIARGALETLRAHPHWLPLLLRPSRPGETAIQALNQLIELMQADGLPAETALHAYVAAASCGLGLALMERTTADAAKRLAMLDAAVRNQPRYASVAAVGRIVEKSRFDEAFNLAIGSLLAELRRKATTPRRGASPGARSKQRARTKRPRQKARKH